MREGREEGKGERVEGRRRDGEEEYAFERQQDFPSDDRKLDSSARTAI